MPRPPAIPQTPVEVAPGKTVTEANPITNLDVTDCRAALNRLAERSMDSCDLVMGEFGVQRVSALEPGRFKAFIDRCVELSK